MLDDIPAPVGEEDVFDNNEPPDKQTRRIDAALLTWTAIKRYIQHHYLEPWIPRMTKYVNKYMKLGDDIWDSPLLADVP